jgi:hypothetical protein
MTLFWGALMRKQIVVGTALAVLVMAGGSAQAAEDLITNGSFESPNLGATNYTYPGLPFGTVTGYPATVDSWTYGGSALVNASSSSAWYGSTPPTGFDGAQFAALQSSSTLSQTFNVTAAEAAGPATLTWLSAGRPNFGSYAGDQTYEVLINGAQVGTDFTTASGTNFVGDDLSLTGLLKQGANTLTFEGLNPTTDETAFIDDVAISAVPEPAVWGMMLFGFFGLGAMARRKRVMLRAA